MQIDLYSCARLMPVVVHARPEDLHSSAAIAIILWFLYVIVTGILNAGNAIVTSFITMTPVACLHQKPLVGQALKTPIDYVHGVAIDGYTIMSLYKSYSLNGILPWFFVLIA